MLQINTKHHICDGCTAKLTLATPIARDKGYRDRCTAKFLKQKICSFGPFWQSGQ